MSKTKKMKFSEDKFVNNVLTYEKDKAYDIPVASVDRWLKRGGVLVDDGKAVKEEKVEDAFKLIEDYTPEELSQFTIAQLHELCDTQGHTEYTTNLKKDELIAGMLEGDFIPLAEEDTEL